MFQRVEYEEWAMAVRTAVSLLLFIVFLIIVIRAVLMSKKKAKRMASMPLDDDGRKEDTSD